MNTVSTENTRPLREVTTLPRFPLEELPLNASVHLNNVDELNQQENVTKKLKLLINGSNKRPLSIDNNMIRVDNTCGFDAIVHAVRYGAITCRRYRQAVNQSHNKFITFVRKVIEGPLDKDVYFMKAKLIETVVPCIDQVMNANVNIWLWITHLFHEEDCTTIRRRCAHCNIEDSTYYPFISPNLVPLMKYGCREFQQCMDSFASDNSNGCRLCLAKPEVEIHESSQLFINLEGLASQIRNYWAGVDGLHKTKLLFTDLPLKLNFGNSIYQLVAVVVHIKTKCIEDHYRCYVHRISGKWEVHDGVSAKSTTRPMSPTDLKDPNNFHLLFYVRL